MPSKTRYEPSIVNRPYPKVPYTMDIRVMIPASLGVNHTAAVVAIGANKPLPWALQIGPCDAMNYVPVVIPNVPLSSIMALRYDIRGQNPYFNGNPASATIFVPTPWTTNWNQVSDFKVTREAD
jgi:hypothetical protein